MSSSAYDAIIAELEQLAPQSGALDAHSHLGSDEDGSSLEPDALLKRSMRSAGQRAQLFSLQDPGRRPAYRVPNDRVLEWGRESGGRLIAYCRLDPDEDPVAEAERCLAKGARGVKLHPRGREWEAVHPAIPAIFAAAREAGRAQGPGSRRSTGHAARRARKGSPGPRAGPRAGPGWPALPPAAARHSSASTRRRKAC